VGAKDIKKGIHTIEQKLEADCPNFKRMDVLFGGRQNVTPACVLTGAKRSAAHILAEKEAAGGGDLSSDDDVSAEEEDDEDEEEDEGGDFHDDDQDVIEALTSLHSACSDKDHTDDAGDFVTKHHTSFSSSGVSSLSTPAVAEDIHEDQWEEKKKVRKRAKKAEAEKATAAALLSANLRDKCAETVATASNAAELTARISEMKNNVAAGNKGKKDFTTTYAETQLKKIELDRERFTFEKENFSVKREDDLAHATAKLQQESKNVILTEMLRKGATAQEIKDFMSMLI
jgi:hypothetical protein